MSLSEHVYCAAITFKMTKWVEQWICNTFCVNLEHSSTETTCMIQKAVAMGNWWLEAAPQQHTYSCITSHAEFFDKTSNHPGNSALLQPWLLDFSKTEITFEREEISDHQWDSGKYNGTADGDWENCGKSQGAYFEGGWGIIFLCTMFFVPCVFFNKCPYFSYYVDEYLLDRPGILKGSSHMYV